jgi:hypothetical protein
MASANTQQELQDQFLSIVRKGQEIALDAIKSMVDTIATITPKIPTVDVRRPAAEAAGRRGQRLRLRPEAAHQPAQVR